MWKELASSLFDSVRNRISSPIFGTFAIAWCVYNSPMLFIVLFGSGVDERMALVNKYVHYSLLSTWGNGLIWPILTTAAYIIFYPIVSYWVYDYNRKHQEKLRLAKQKWDRSRLLTVEEGLKLRSEMESQERRHQETVADLAKQITDLRAIREAEGNGADRAYGKDHFELLRRFAARGPLPHASAVPLDIRRKSALDDLENDGLVANTTRGYDLSVLGRKYVIENGLDQSGSTT